MFQCGARVSLASLVSYTAIIGVINELMIIIVLPPAGKEYTSLCLQYFFFLTLRQVVMTS